MRKIHYLPKKADLKIAEIADLKKRKKKKEKRKTDASGNKAYGTKVRILAAETELLCKKSTGKDRRGQSSHIKVKKTESRGSGQITGKERGLSRKYILNKSLNVGVQGLLEKQTPGGAW
ncbi:uncharacterized protein LOC126947191 isoform X1 [Macaca thibetana thibetana]|uniref:uncharacterized protein LOC126947191 isoform X1 n=1 Tax=Macaca thibetana thibetana TaxID=257877 RepID=UPI0021BCB0CC|nr:uncharacterized protein LOC126947191 isoform X1 [Macaca thibetana thibetana]